MKKWLYWFNTYTIFDGAIRYVWFGRTAVIIYWWPEFRWEIHRDKE